MWSLHSHAGGIYLIHHDAPKIETNKPWKCMFKCSMIVANIVVLGNDKTPKIVVLQYGRQSGPYHMFRQDILWSAVGRQVLSISPHMEILDTFHWLLFLSRKKTQNTPARNGPHLFWHSYIWSHWERREEHCGDSDIRHWRNNGPLFRLLHPQCCRDSLLHHQVRHGPQE